MNIHLREGVVLLFVYECDGFILNNLALELSFFAYVFVFFFSITIFCI